MKVIGIIVEYNPLHNGHIYMINKIKERYPDSIIIAILSGYFTQRGDISVLTKEDKVKYALKYGVDIVVELPFIYTVQSADIFAYYSVKILNKLHIDTLIFGSVCNDIDKLYKLVDKQNNKEFQDKVKEYLDEGNSYPTSTILALEEDFDYNPNDILGISYIKAIEKINKDIKVETIKRTVGYFDIKPIGDIASGTYIRTKIQNNEDVSKYTPCKELIKENNGMYFKLLRTKILTDNHLDEYLDVTEGIDNLLKKKIKYITSYPEFIRNTKSKRYTFNRICRMYMHILMGVRKNYKDEDYLRILGFNKKGIKYLHNNNIEEIYKNTDAYNMELIASCIYDMINDKKAYLYERKNKPIIK